MERVSMVLEASMKHGVIVGFLVCGFPATEALPLQFFRTTLHYRQGCRSVELGAKYSHVRLNW
jgi:hypothetical protein